MLATGCGKTAQQATESPSGFTSLSAEESAEWDTLASSTEEDTDSVSPLAVSLISTSSVKTALINNISYPVTDGYLTYNSKRYQLTFASNYQLTFTEIAFTPITEDMTETTKRIHSLRAKRSRGNAFSTEQRMRTSSGNMITTGYSYNAKMTYYNQAITSDDKLPKVVGQMEMSTTSLTSPVSIKITVGKTAYYASVDQSATRKNSGTYDLNNAQGQKVAEVTVSDNMDKTLPVFTIRKPNKAGILRIVTILRPGVMY